MSVYIETDARFRVEAVRRVKGVSPGDERSESVVVWESGKLAAIDKFGLSTMHWPLPKKGQVFEYGGVLWQVIEPQPVWTNSIIAIKYEGWWTWLLYGWFWLKRRLDGINPPGHGPHIDHELDKALEKVLAELGFKRWASGCDLVHPFERDLSFEREINDQEDPSALPTEPSQSP